MLRPRFLSSDRGSQSPAATTAPDNRGKAALSLMRATPNRYQTGLAAGSRERPLGGEQGHQPAKATAIKRSWSIGVVDP